jgi:hypothetical protein
MIDPKDKTRKGGFLTARALPSRSRDLSLLRRNGFQSVAGDSEVAPPFQPLGRRSGRIPAEPCLPPRYRQYMSRCSPLWKFIASDRRTEYK